MPNIKVSDLPLAEPLTGEELLLGVQDGGSVKIEGQMIAEIPAIVNAVGAAESARDAAIAASTITGVYPAAAASNVPRGATGIGAITPGSGGTNGTFALAFSGGNFSINPTGTFTVVGGAVTAINITGPGLYVGAAPSAPTLSFAASTGLTGANASLVVDFLVQSGKSYWVADADGLNMTMYNNVGGAATISNPVVRQPAAARVAAVEDGINGISDKTVVDYFTASDVVEGYIGLTGTFVSSSTWRTTGFIPYDPKATYKYTGYGSTITLSVSGWDADKNFVGSVYQTSGQVVDVAISVTDPQIAYLRVSSGAAPYTRSFIETARRVTKAALGQFTTQVDKNTQDVADLSAEVSSILKPESIDYAQDPGVRNGYTKLDGTFVPSTNWRETPLIEIVPGATYTFTGYGSATLVSNVSLWDANGQWLESIYAHNGQVVGVPITFSNPNAKYIRASSGVNPYTFAFLVEGTYINEAMIKSLGGIKSDIAELKEGAPTTVRAFAPTEAYALQGETLYLNARGIVVDPSLDVAWNVPLSNDLAAPITPTSTADIPLVLRGMGRNGPAIDIASFNVKVTGTPASPSIPQNFIALGDSLTEGISVANLQGAYPNELSRRLTGIGTDILGGGPAPLGLTNIYFRGTLGDQPIKHEGRGGWRASDYLTKASVGALTNAFWNPSTSLFDIDYYLQQNGFRAEDTASGVVTDGSNLTMIILLGWNDVYSSSAATSAANVGALIDRVKAGKPNAKFIVLGLNPPPKLNYKSFTGTRYVSPSEIFQSAIVEFGTAYRDMCAGKTNCSFLQLSHQFQPEGAYRTSARKIGARIQETVVMADDHVHPNLVGQAQIADALYYKILYDYCRG